MSEKRKFADEEVQGTLVAEQSADAGANQQALVLAKKPRTDEASSSGAGGALVAVQPNAGQLIRAADGNQAPPRTSSLQAATMQLTGHAAAVYANRFSPSGGHLASAGGDKLIFLWTVGGECQNTGVFTGHDGPVLDLAWSPQSDLLFSASTDKTAGVWDVESGARVKRCRGHSAIVNAVGVSRRGTQTVITGSDDCTVNLWDIRSRRPTQTLQESYPILSACFNDDSTQVFSAGISNDIKCWDLRTSRLLYTLIGHRDSVTGLRLSPDGSFLLSNSMDASLRAWDVRPFVAGDTRLTCVYKGHTHDLEQNLLRCAWSADGLRVAAGSADKTVNVWEAATGKGLYRLPGHKGAVNDVDFHPTQPILASASSDKLIWIGEYAV